MAIRAVLFDLGNTLLFPAHSPDDRLYERMEERVRPLIERWSSRPHDVLALLRDLYDAVGTAQPERRAQGYEVDGPFIARGALSAHDVDVSEEQARAFWRASFVGLAARGWQLFPDALDSLRRLRDLSIPAALVSNGIYTSDLIRADLATFGIGDDLLPVQVTSPDLMQPKPDAAIFRRALDALAVAPHEAAHIGDSLEADVRGAKALGLTTVLKLNGRHEVPEEADADYTIHDLWELFGLGLFGGSTPFVESLTPHEDGNADRY